MTTTIDKLTADGCSTDDKHKVCRSRGGESCAFDGAMIVLQPIADTAHIVHGPIACCGNSWEGRGTQSSKGELHTMGFTTDMGEIDIVYGSEEKLLNAIKRTHETVNPNTAAQTKGRTRWRSTCSHTRAAEWQRPTESARR